MKYQLIKYIFSPFILLAVLTNISTSQKSSYSNNEKAIYYFIEGKTLELQNDFIGAVENYRTALKFDKSAGIYHALSEVYFRLGKLDEAKSEVKNALKLKPENQDYLETLADVQIAQRDFTDAIDTYEKIISLDSNYTYGLYSLARLYQERKMPAKAIVIYEKITNKIGYDYDVLNKMYEIYIAYKDYEKAIETLESLQKLDPFNFGIKSILASLYIRNNRISDARRIYEELFVLNPENKEIQTELVKIYFQQNESGKAFENFSRMLGKDSLGYIEKVQVGELYYNMISQDEPAREIAKNIFYNLNQEYPDEWIPYYYLGVFDVVENRVDDYREKFNRAIELADTSSEAYVNIGLIYFQQNEAQDALNTVNEGLGKFQDEYRLFYVKGLALQRMNREADAIAEFEKAVEINPKDLAILSTLALAHDTQGNFRKSEEIYEMALLIDPQNALILNNYAYNLSERGEKLDKALAMAKIAVEKDPGNSSYLDTIGWIYFKMKNYKLAKLNIEKSLEVNPNSAVVLDHLGDVFKAMKDNTNALKFWKLSLEKDPGNASVKEKIEFYKVS
jgi:tetratricopeptide (TPR) repeat protein